MSEAARACSELRADRGDFLGVRATGRSVEFEVLDVLRVCAGCATGQGRVAAPRRIFSQLGVLPPC